ncbi:enoyl-CoA hydratase-related protein [Janthinobacterium sp. 17J80-10]|uniref:enoyl-CoA hydratase-related protein n=1 Tax=Janthinobacterium sp. 17J80-10 TaxID=2497863 RepID=UPI001005369D|nr:enoyl-CoA hydratase-related protein [Janthinobacterium sp. 17J80-10]QAU33254.1 enoyl-CoA hydratase [Janthinobacterium sp. 17J80-10]
MDQINSPVLQKHLNEHILLVTLNRPAARNAINGALTAALGQIVEDTESNPDIWAVILTGSGDKAFSAGADLREVADGRVAQLSTPRGGFAGFANFQRSKTWIAAVNGPALAGGMEIALACDMIIAADTSIFGLPEVKRGLMATEGGLYRLPRVIPRAIALEMIATGNPISAARALSLGLVNDVVPADKLIESAYRLASGICENSPLAVRESLRIARHAQAWPEERLHREGHEALAKLAKTEDYQEGPSAFLEKRTPKWTGR